MLKRKRRRKKRVPLDHKLNKHMRKKREIFFRPILKDLKKMGVTANMISNTRVFLALFFLPLFVYSKIAGAIFMAFILFLDLIDGSLARYSRTASDRGKFIDVSVDHLVYSIIAATLMAFGADSFILGYNFFIIPVVYVLAIIKKQEFEKTDWIIKPYPKVSYIKTLPVLAFFIASFFTLHPIAVNWALAISNFIATLLVIYYFVYIQIRWKFKKEE